MAKHNRAKTGQIIVHAASNTLKMLSAFGAEQPFLLMRDGLFYELGFYLPTVNLDGDDQLAAGHFAFTINGERLASQVGIGADRRLVDVEVETLGTRNIDSVSATNPATGDNFAIVSSTDAATLQEEGHTVWNPLGYLILHLSAALRRKAWQLFNQKIAQGLGEQMESLFPTLSEPVHARFPLALRTEILRLLIRDQVSIRNMRRIYQALIDYDTIVADGRNLIIFDERNTALSTPPDNWLRDPAVLATYLRTHLKAQISHQLTRGQTTLIVYLLDPDVETVLSNPEMLPIGDYLAQLEPAIGRRLRQLIQHEYDLSLLSKQPVILTTATVAPIFRGLIFDFAPQIPVVSYQELSPDMNIQPIGRLSWS